MTRKAVILCAFYLGCLGLAMSGVRFTWLENLLKPAISPIAELQAAEPGSERQKAAGVAVCRERRGPNAQTLWTEDGSLVCRLDTVHLIQSEQP